MQNQKYSILNQVIAPEMYIVAQLNRRGLRTYNLQAMIDTTEHLMTCGFNVTYAFTEPAGISLLFDINESSYERDTAKFISILAAEASARLTQLTGELATFDSSVLALPNKDLVVEYFRSQESGPQNSSWSYWRGDKNSIRELVTIRKNEKHDVHEKPNQTISSGWF